MVPSGWTGGVMKRLRVADAECGGYRAGRGILRRRSFKAPGMGAFSFYAITAFTTWLPGLVTLVRRMFTPDTG